MIKCACIQLAEQRPFHKGIVCKIIWGGREGGGDGWWKKRRKEKGENYITNLSDMWRRGQLCKSTIYTPAILFVESGGIHHNPVQMPGREGSVR